MNDLLMYIDQIDQETSSAEINVLESLIQAYDKTIMIIQESTDDTDLSEFSIFQEGSELTTLKGKLNNLDRELTFSWNSDKNIGKSILMFIPRLMALVIRITIWLLKFIIQLIPSLISAIANSIDDKKHEYDNKEYIKIDFNPEYVVDTVDSFIYLCESVQNMADMDIGGDAKLVSNKKAYYHQLSKVLKYPDVTKLRQGISEFDKDANKETEITRGQLRNCMDYMKRHKRELNKYLKLFNKLANMKDDPSDKLDPADKKTANEFIKLVTDFGKKMTEFSKKIQDIKKKDVYKKPAVQMGPEKKQMTFEYYVNKYLPSQINHEIEKELKEAFGDRPNFSEFKALEKGSPNCILSYDKGRFTANCRLYIGKEPGIELLKHFMIYTNPTDINEESDEDIFNRIRKSENNKDLLMYYDLEFDKSGKVTKLSRKYFDNH